jgi:hypothetical protein
MVLFGFRGLCPLSGNSFKEGIFLGLSFSTGKPIE